jgi:hypothetical protein
MSIGVEPKSLGRYINDAQPLSTVGDELAIVTRNCGAIANVLTLSTE